MRSVALSGPELAPGARRLHLRPTSVVELSGHGPNPNYIGQGSSPWIGDISDDLISLPPTPPLANSGSTPGYLVRICAMDVRMNHIFRFRGFWQDLRLGFSQTNTDGSVTTYEVPQIDPYWRFPDGYVTWMLRVETGIPITAINNDVSPRIGFVPWNAGGNVPGVLFVTPNDGARGTGTYTAPGGGLPPGVGLESYGSVKSLRASSFHAAQTVSLDIPVPGPARVSMYAYVVQHNAANVLPPPLNPTATTPLLTREDQLLLAQPSLHYTRIGGGMFGDLGAYNSARENECP